MAQWPFLRSAQVARQLAALARPVWGHPMARVEADVRRRREAEDASMAMRVDSPADADAARRTLALVPGDALGLAR